MTFIERTFVNVIIFIHSFNEFHFKNLKNHFTMLSSSLQFILIQCKAANTFTKIRFSNTNQENLIKLWKLKLFFDLFIFCIVCLEVRTSKCRFICLHSVMYSLWLQINVRNKKNSSIQLLILIYYLGGASQLLKLFESRIYFACCKHTLCISYQKYFRMLNNCILILNRKRIFQQTMYMYEEIYCLYV